jgi:hypothetical protein
MALKKAFDISKLSNKTQQILNSNPNSYLSVGVNGEQLDEVKVRYNKSPGELLTSGPRNTYIKQGYDRPGTVNSGRGGETGAGSITLVAGPMSAKPRSVELSPQKDIQKMLYADPNIALDASMIYIEQKTDVDINFNIAKGQAGSLEARSAIVAKADAVRIIGREGIKIVTKVDKMNSVGGKIKSVPRIELIAGNRGNALQASTRASTNNKSLQKVFDRLDEINATLDFFITSQLEFNSAIASHQHPDSFHILLGLLGAGNPLSINAGQCLPAFELLTSGAKCSAQEFIAKSDNIMTKLKIAASKINSTEVFGVNQAGSKSVFSN